VHRINREAPINHDLAATYLVLRLRTIGIIVPA
jgi:hypothetical protein